MMKTLIRKHLVTVDSLIVRHYNHTNSKNPHRINAICMYCDESIFKPIQSFTSHLTQHHKTDHSIQGVHNRVCWSHWKVTLSLRAWSYTGQRIDPHKEGQT